MKPNKASIAAELVKKFPNTPTKTLAAKLFKDEPLLFSSLEAARSSIRYVRGAIGNKHRDHKEGVQFANKGISKGPQSISPFASLPEGISHFAEREAYEIEGVVKIGMICDSHIPYHSKDALVIALDYIKKYKPTHILLNGDIADFYATSRWENDPRKRDLANEIKTVREFLATLRKEFKKQEIIYKLGNHEERWERYLSVKAPEILGVADFEVEKILHFDHYRITGVRDMRPIKAGTLNIIHGHEFRWGITSPVNPARGFYQRGKENCIGGHLHQSSSHSETSMNGSVISCWSVGSTCDLKPDYARFNKWNHGFATIEVDNSGEFEVNNLKIVNSKIYSA